MWRMRFLTPGEVIFIHWKQLLDDLKQIFPPRNKVAFLFFLHAGYVDEIKVITPKEFLTFHLPVAHLHSRGTSTVKPVEKEWNFVK